MGFTHGGLIGGQGPKSGVYLWGHYWGPGAEKWGPLMGGLLGARGRKVKSIHRGIIELGARGRKRVTHGYYCGAGSFHVDIIEDQ